MNELEGLKHRLDRLERENRWLKRLGTFVLVGATALALMGQQRGPAPVVEAQRFLINDPASGKARAALSLLQDGSVGLSLISVDGKSLSLSADAGGNMGLSLVDSNRTLRAELFAGADGSPALILHDRSGKVIWKAP
ncbi:MAG: hypothetical protein DMD88_05215 [Candidatus Rokuibacteriota bacterium]|nr:MAG: hypothetical protein DMD88_05215 [Candidatus Rokubacteria bacterium]